MKKKLLACSIYTFAMVVLVFILLNNHTHFYGSLSSVGDSNLAPISYTKKMVLNAANSFSFENSDDNNTKNNLDNYSDAHIEDSFYYEDLSNDLIDIIYGKSYKEDCIIPYSDLRHVVVKYYDFNGNIETGELVCNKVIAQDLVEIFYDLFCAKYPIESIKLIDYYNADDELSMENNNTSSFNYRTIAGKNNLSKHAQGLAIDINPLYNPYVKTDKNGITIITPKGSESYADRNNTFNYKITTDDLCYKLFSEHGFTWGGNWKTLKDYQHFEK